MIEKVLGNVGIDLLFYVENDIEYYTPVITFFFNEEGTRFSSIPCDIRSVDKLAVLEQCLHNVTHLFVRIAAVVNVIDFETAEIIEVINLNDSERFNPNKEPKVLH